MNILRNIAASLICLILVQVILAAILLLSITNTYLNPNFYTTENFEEKIYDALIEESSKAILHKQPELREYFSAIEIQSMTKEVITFKAVIEIVNQFLKQLEEEPLPDEIVLHIGEIKKNARILIQENKTLSEKIDANAIGYFATEINIPLGALPDGIQNAMSLFFQNRKNLMAQNIVMSAILTVMIIMVLWKPFSRGLIWNAGIFIATGLPMAILGYGLKASVSAPYQGQESLIQTISNPILNQVITISLIVTGIGVLHLINFFLLRHYETKGSVIAT